MAPPPHRARGSPTPDRAHTRAGGSSAAPPARKRPGQGRPRRYPPRRAGRRAQARPLGRRHRGRAGSTRWSGGRLRSLPARAALPEPSPASPLSPGPPPLPGGKSPWGRRSGSQDAADPSRRRARAPPPPPPSPAPPPRSAAAESRPRCAPAALTVFGIFPADWARQVAAPAPVGLSAGSALLLTGLGTAPLRPPARRAASPARPRPGRLRWGGSCGHRASASLAGRGPAVRREAPRRESPPRLQEASPGREGKHLCDPSGGPGGSGGVPPGQGPRGSQCPKAGCQKSRESPEH